MCVAINLADPVYLYSAFSRQCFGAVYYGDYVLSPFINNNNNNNNNNRV